VSDTLSPSSADDVLAAVQDAVAQEQPLEIVGRGTKRGWGRPVKSNRILDLSGLSGVTLYEPDELVLSAMAGTPMAEIEALLAENKQMLAFEPPHFADGGTLGGAVAAGLSGPRRPFAGAVRDFVLGTGLINGKGEHLNFGGQVMKNVAGYDLSRLMAGALGTLGVLTDVGSLTPHIVECLKGCDALVVECNHDPAMLAAGDYPPSLKERVGGRHGHLNNAQAAELLGCLETGKLQHVVAAHLSEKNNRPHLARRALAAVLRCETDWIAVADQEQGLAWREVM